MGSPFTCFLTKFWLPACLLALLVVFVCQKQKTVSSQVEFDALLALKPNTRSFELIGTLTLS